MSLARRILAPGALCLMAATSHAAPGDRAYSINTPPTSARNPFYVSNRAPLAPNPLVKLPIGSIKPGSWLRTQLRLTADGYTGHLEEISAFCKFDGNAWVSPTGEGSHGWEEVPYWLKGFGDLGYVLSDPRITAEARKWIDGVLSSQRPDGYFGPRGNIKTKDTPTGPMVTEQLDLWPNMPMLNALESYYDATGDKRVLTFMAKYFRWQLNIPESDILPGYWDKMRGGDNLQSIYWLYNRTGEAWLLDAAKKVYASTAKWSDGVVNWHGVNICQGFRAPAIYSQQSHNPADFSAAERNYRTVMAKYGQTPGGMFGADENAREGYSDPRQAAETCSMVEFMHSDQLLLGISGNPVYADRCEDIAFNSFPAAQTPDMKGLHYLTAANQPQLDRESKAPGIQNGGDMFSYNPNQYRCCQHNVAMGWPYYAENLFMATQDRGLAAVLYAASTVTARVGPGDGAKVTLKEATDYPFSEAVRFTLSAKEPVAFPLYLRVPGWAKGATVAVNGKAQDVHPAPQSYIVLERTWHDGDEVSLTLPMPITVKTWTANKDAVSVERGPLTYSLKIGEKWVKYGSDPWPGYEVFPTTPWNYGLVLDAKDPASSFEVVEKPGPLAAQPFTLEAAPIEIRAKGRRIPNWGLTKGLVNVLQESPAETDQPVEDITLIPMGAARLRIAAFPVASSAPSAHPWVLPPAPRHTASYENDDINAPSDGIVPKSSNDQSIPRFTWWDRRGTEEWITYDLKTPRRVSASSVYWFDDRESGGGCRVPQSWMLYYKKGDAWEPVRNTTPYGTERDALNRVAFTPVTTDALKIVAQFEPEMSSGILEWTVE